jgi:uncharacterized radical SAM protein YgiQ
MSFLPTTREEMRARGWEQCDVIIVTGDSYIDSPFIGTAVVGRLLEHWGWRVGIIAQPDLQSDDVARLGEPRLFWGVNAGSIDSMVANYTAALKRRKSDDYTPGGVNDRRPDRACIAYANLIRRHFKATRPIVLGGIEASLRRVSHYDFWSDSVRRPLLFDAKADYLIYGMGENALRDLTRALDEGRDARDVRGICYIAPEPREGYIELPSHDEASCDKMAYMRLFDEFYRDNDPLNAKGLSERVGERYLIQNPPAPYATSAELDEYAALPYMLAQHPYYERQGSVKCLETIKFALQTHQGCWGECNFCAITVHQGRTIRSRSEESIIAEIERWSKRADFKGIIHDLGGASANMYGFECAKKLRSGACKAKRCADFGGVCDQMPIDHAPLIRLMRRVDKLPNVRKSIVASGVRYDLILRDKAHGKAYLKELSQNHVGGQMKIAPEHVSDRVLRAMGKPPRRDLLEFKKLFDELNKGRKQYLTYYFIAAHPGCEMSDMMGLADFTKRELRLHPEQTQIFTPTPSTYSAAMYYTGLDYKSKKPIYVEKSQAAKEKQKSAVTPSVKRVDAKHKMPTKAPKRR